MSEDIKELMKEIEKKAENPETQLEALELIQANINKLPMKAFWLAKSLMKVDNPEVKERAKQVVDEYMKRFPQFEEFERNLEALRASLQSLEQIGKILTNQSKVLEQLRIHEVIKHYAEWSKKMDGVLKKLLTISEIPKIPEIPITPSPEVIMLQKIEEIKQKIEKLEKDIEELREIRQEEREKLKRKLKELEEELDRAYQ